LKTITSLFFVLSSLSAGALAAPLEARNAEPVRVTVAKQAKQGFGLRARPEGWRLDLGPVGGNATAEVVDITPGTAARTLMVVVNGDSLLFDNTRFWGGHVYRVQLRRAGQPVSSGIVYLYPDPQLKEAPRSTQPARVKFAADEQPADSAAPAPVAKSGL
jgi:hypothetical protein